MPSATSTTSFRLSGSERAALDAAAASAGLGPSSFVRRAVMAACGQTATVRQRPDGLARAVGRALGDLGRIGNNLNQLARAGNRGCPVPDEAVNGCRHELARLTAAVLALREPPR
ncbi:plasmid mobilization relaxosome protein MobC [Chelativorans sp. ZYF759]|uniref:plasmid mobilization protein n=1 Tax=Chelativorans sp. ZYF759 TaxID=2692213 RepID=UPI00145E404B|nr:plasmid mobilization relaxosome protein MobC [Chelativorans sp. ZYF759]